MSWLFLFASLSVVAYASECSCSSGTLSHSYDSAVEVFSANVLGTSNVPLVAVTEIFKGFSFSVGDLVYIRYACGTFPVRAGGEGVFFTTAPAPAEGSFVTHLVECTRNGPITSEEKRQLQSGIFLPGGKCTDPETGKVYAEGESFNMGCNSCVCVNGDSKCTDMPCDEPNPPTQDQSCTTYDGRTVRSGNSIKVDCNMCTCNNGNLLCTEMTCEPQEQQYCEGSSGRRLPGEIWETTDNGCTRRWSCQEDGRSHLIDDSCVNSNGSSKFFIIGISLASAIVVVIMATVVAVIRNRIRAREARSTSVLLDDVSPDSDSDDAPAPQHNHNHNHFGGGYGFANTNMATQPFAYPSTPAWGGQPLATTPMVLMTQTGEPVVVQVAYM